MNVLLKSLGEIGAAETVDEVWKTVIAYVSPLGFSRVNYGLTRYRLGASVGNLDDTLFLTTMCPDYIAKYLHCGVYAHTPIFKWLMLNTGVTSYRWAEDDYLAGKLSEDESEAMKLNKEFGIRAGIVISFPDSSQRIKGAIGLSADKDLTHDDVDRIWKAHGPAISAICNMMHLKIINLPMTSAARTLTARQREALEWVADGKTTQDTGILMGISVAMVEKHLRLARNALGVETTAQAVAKGTLLRMMHVPKTKPATPKPPGMRR